MNRNLESLTYASIEYLRKNRNNVFEAMKKDNVSLGTHLLNIFGPNYKEPTKFYKPIINFDMSDLNNPKSTDFNNAKLIYENFINLTESQASDFRFWSGYAINEDTYNYLKYRWNDTAKTIYYRITAHQNGRRGLAYHGFARLWWFAHLTYDEKNTDPFELTKFTFDYPHIMEKMVYRNFFNSKTIRTGIIKGIKLFLESGGKYQTKKLDSLYVHISLISSVSLLDVISEHEIMNIANDFLNSLSD